MKQRLLWALNGSVSRVPNYVYLATLVQEITNQGKINMHTEYMPFQKHSFMIA